MRHTSRTTFADRATRGMAVLTVACLAGLAGWISYRHMVLLARRSGHSGIDAHAFPLTVDGLDLIGVLVLLADRRTNRRSGPLPWTVLGVGAAASVVANIAVAPDNAVARAISGWSAIALLAAAKMLAHLFEPAQATAEVPSGPCATETADEPRRLAAVATSFPAATDAPGAATPDVADGPESAPQPGSDIVRRLPTGETALNRWRRIWQATKHLDAATAEAAAEHRVSLRTLQFIRAAGEQGHLKPTGSPAPTAPDAPLVCASGPTQSNHRNRLDENSP